MNTAECKSIPSHTALGCTASMEPPCEHGGVTSLICVARLALVQLQWSRRVNTAECSTSHALASPS